MPRPVNRAIVRVPIAPGVADIPAARDHVLAAAIPGLKVIDARHASWPARGPGEVATRGVEVVVTADYLGPVPEAVEPSRFTLGELRLLADTWHQAHRPPDPTGVTQPASPLDVVDGNLGGL